MANVFISIVYSVENPLLIDEQGALQRCEPDGISTDGISRHGNVLSIQWQVFKLLLELVLTHSLTIIKDC